MTNENTRYRIKIKGHLDTRWQEWFHGLTITQTDGGNTLLSGEIVDQAALHGVFQKNPKSWPNPYFGQAS